MKSLDLLWSYAFKHWLFTLLLSPLIYQLVIIDRNFLSEIKDFLSIEYWDFLILGAVLSLPTLMAYLIVFFLLKNGYFFTSYPKLILTLLSLVGIWVSLIAVMGSGHLWNIPMLLILIGISYSLTALLGGWIFKLKRPNFLYKVP